ncbi:MAG: FAD-binding protein, partial [Eubacteriales bacterium]|nr:FAD-binding protein [Eubacteriales bacterium]
GEAFMTKAHPLGDLASRDVVSQAIFRQMMADRTDYVYLDITHHTAEFLKNRFPMIYETCLQRGFDMANDFLPVAPVQHYFMGGISTDLHARTTLGNLYACGEAAHTGIYGANRLASNSLLECLVYGRRAAQTINQALRRQASDPVHYLDLETLSALLARARASTSADRAVALAANMRIPAAETTVDEDRQQIRTLMTRYCGILRSKDGLLTAQHGLDAIHERREQQPVHNLVELEAAQMTIAARAIVQAALHRRHSVGAHYRTDDHRPNAVPVKNSRETSAR